MKSRLDLEVMEHDDDATSVDDECEVSGDDVAGTTEQLLSFLGCWMRSLVDEDERSSYQDDRNVWLGHDRGNDCDTRRRPRGNSIEVLGSDHEFAIEDV